MIESFPQGKQDARSRTIAALAVKWPLTAKQLHSAISKDGGKPLTYQAVHKVLGELSAGRLLLKSAAGYSLSPGWVEAQKAWWLGASKRYSGGEPPSLADIAPGSSLTHSFKGAISAPYWLISETPSVVTKSDPVVQHWFFGWPGQMVSGDEHQNIKKYLHNGGNYLLCRGDTPADRHVLKYFEQTINAKWKAGADVAKDCDTVAFRDYIVNIYWPAALRKAVKIAFSKPDLAATMQSLYDYAFAGEGAKLEVPVVITRNKEIAKQIIDETLAVFRKGRK